MSGWFVLGVLLAAINPPRLRPYMDARTRLVETLAAVTIVFSAGALFIGFATGILDAFEITDETWNIGAGLVGILVGGRVLVIPRFTGIEVPERWTAAVAPFAFPLLFTPQLAALTILLGASESKTAAIGLLGAALTLTIGVCSLRYRNPNLWSAAARFLGASLVILSVALVIAGIRDV